jgi:hypothetical protein
MHGERPTSTVLELTDTESIGETGWPPPPRQTLRLNAAKTCSTVAEILRDVLNVVIAPPFSTLSSD